MTKAPHPYDKHFRCFEHWALTHTPTHNTWACMHFRWDNQSVNRTNQWGDTRSRKYKSSTNSSLDIYSQDLPYCFQYLLWTYLSCVLALTCTFLDIPLLAFAVDISHQGGLTASVSLEVMGRLWPASRPCVDQTRVTMGTTWHHEMLLPRNCSQKVFFFKQGNTGGCQLFWLLWWSKIWLSVERSCDIWHAISVGC